MENKRIKIALLVPWIKSKGGVERVVLEILKNKKYDVTVFTFGYEAKKTFGEFGAYRIVRLAESKHGKFVGRGASLAMNLLLHKIPDLDTYDIFMISTAGIAELAALRNRHPLTVALTHTPLRAAHSMYDYYKNGGIAYRMVMPIAAGLYKVLERRSWENIDYALVLSEEVKSRLIDYGLMPANRIFKLGPHADYSGARRHGKTKKIIFYGSRFTPYKRQDLAVHAFRMSRLPLMGFKLVLGGFVENEKYFDKIKKMTAGDRNISVIRDLPEKELKRLYSECYVTLFMAINEDTGLAPLESLAYGKPVISVNEGGPKEFVKNGRNGLLVDASPIEIAHAMNAVADKKLYKKLVKGAVSSPVYDEKRFMGRFDESVKAMMKKRKI